MRGESFYQFATVLQCCGQCYVFVHFLPMSIAKWMLIPLSAQFLQHSFARAQPWSLQGVDAARLELNSWEKFNWQDGNAVKQGNAAEVDR